MPLAAGARLGPYEILAPIGAGGMGEVYRARDPRLGRDVAIKVLPASFSSDADRLKRFEQEARAAGVLNHPNITGVYDIGQHDGAPYVVQELLEGDTLRMELGGGRFSPRRATEYATQIAQGLAAAHDKGIVHRDLKPENLFVTKEGRVKILDFGLAKLTQTDGARASGTSLPTETRGTEPGVVLGTLGYMSPEQVKGKPADARSDIFAFGAILYELLSGKRAFQGDSAAETISAILREDPPDLSVTNKSISPGLERIVRHCLEKNPERRFQSASDIAFDLETLSGSSGSVVALTGAGQQRTYLRRGTVWLAVFAALAAGVLAASRLRRTPPPSYRQLTFRRGNIPTARFAPDGQTVVFSASFDGGPRRIYSLRPGSPEWSPLNLPELDLYAVSGTGELAVGPVSTEGEAMREAPGSLLARVPMSGGSPRSVLNDVADADWAPDGVNLAVVHDVHGRSKLEFPIGTVRYESSNRVESPRVAPSGDHVGFVDHPIAEETLGSILVVDRSGPARTLSKDWFDIGQMAWSPDAKEIWFSASATGARRSLWAVTLSGQLRPLAETPGSSLIMDVSSAGKVIVNHQSWRAYISGSLPGETELRDFTWLDFSFPTDLSDDGKTLLFQEWGEGGGTKGAVYLRRLDGSPPVRLGEGFGLSLSPDGEWVLARLYTKPARLILLPTGAGESRPLPVEGMSVDAAAWFPDGKRILLLGTAGGKPLYSLLDVATGRTRPLAISKVSNANRGIRRGNISPDGRLLARLGEGGRADLLSLDNGESRPAVGITQGEEPIRWSADGRLLYVVRRKGMSNVITRVDPVSGQREAWKQFVISSDPVGLRGGAGSVHLSADGNTCFWGYQRYVDELYLVEGLK